MDSLVEQHESSQERTGKELIEQKLNPIVETDLLGFKRTTFDINDTKFSFRGREEILMFESLSTHKVELLGDHPKFLEKEKFEGYFNWFGQSQNDGEAPKYLLSTRTIRGVIELSRRLGGNNSEAEEVLADLEHWNYSPKVLNLLDQLIAASYVDDQGGILEKANSYGEALVTLLLIGDEEAKLIVNKKVEQLRKFDETKNKERIDGLRNLVSTTYRDVEGLNPKNLVAVHTTRYLPVTNQDGEFIVPTTFDATRGGSYRNTVHTSLNHKVEPVNLGFNNWSDTEYTLVSPFNSMVAANGLPTCFKTIDTWWAQNPGEPLIFKDAILIRPGDATQSELIAYEGKELRYKPSRFLSKDLAGLAALNSAPGELSLFIKDFNKQVFGLLDSRIEQISSEDIDLVRRSLLSLIGQESEEGLEDNAQLLGQIIGDESKRGQSMKERIQDLLIQSEVPPAILDSDQNNLLDLLVSSTEGFIKMKLSDSVIRQVISKQGEVKRGGSRTWAEGEWEVFYKEMKTAAQLGIGNALLHLETSQGIADETFKRCFLSAFSDFNSYYDRYEIEKRFGWELGRPSLEDEFGMQEYWERQRFFDRVAQISGFKWFKFGTEQLDRLMKDLDQKTRRYIYATGLLNSRG